MTGRSNSICLRTLLILSFMFFYSIAFAGDEFEIPKGSRSKLVVYDAGNGQIGASGQFGIYNGRSTSRMPVSIWFVGEGGVKIGNNTLKEGTLYIVNKNNEPEELKNRNIKVYKEVNVTANCYRQKGVKENIISEIKQGQKVELVLAGTQNWDKIRINNKLFGWVESENLGIPIFVEK